jgi:hypothetical protein
MHAPHATGLRRYTDLIGSRSLCCGSWWWGQPAASKTKEFQGLFDPDGAIRAPSYFAVGATLANP